MIYLKAALIGLAVGVIPPICLFLWSMVRINKIVNLFTEEE